MLSLLILILESCWIELLFFLECIKGPPGPLISKSAFVFEVQLIQCAILEKLSSFPCLPHGQQLVIQEVSPFGKYGTYIFGRYLKCPHWSVIWGRKGSPCKHSVLFLILACGYEITKVITEPKVYQKSTTSKQSASSELSLWLVTSL